MAIAREKALEFGRGWSLLLTATIGNAVGLVPVIFYSLGSFIGPLQTEFGWSRGDISSSYLFTTIVLAIAAPGLGSVIDRFGVRLLALVSIPLLAIVFFTMSRFSGSSVLAFQSYFALAAIVGLGTTPVVYTRIVAGAFDKARGIALGISLSGVAVTTMGLPLLLASVVQSYSWRAGFLTLGLLVLIAWPFILLGTIKMEKPVVRPKTGVVDTKVFRTSIFWILGIAFAGISIAVGALIVHLVPLLRDAGMTPVAAAGVASFIGIGAIIGRLITGYLIDHFFAPFVAATAFLLTASSCLLLLYVGADVAAVTAVFLGLALGAEIDLIAYFTVRYFGIARYGFVYSMIYSMFVISSALGPALAGRAFDVSGSYKTTIWTAIVVLTVSSLAILKLPRFEEFEQTQFVPASSSDGSSN